MKLRDRFENPNRPIEFVLFPNTRITSVVAKQNGTDAEIGLVGCEGMTGTAIILGNRSFARTRPISRSPEMAANLLRRTSAAAMDQSPSMHGLFP